MRGAAVDLFNAKSAKRGKERKEGRQTREAVDSLRALGMVEQLQLERLFCDYQALRTKDIVLSTQYRVFGE